MQEVLLEIKKVKKTYRERKNVEKYALKEINFDLYQGEIFGLLGVNGAGKTTLSSIIASLHSPSSGDVIWKGQSIYSQLIEYRKVIGFCPQKQNIDLNLTIEQNLVLQGRFYGYSMAEINKTKDHLLEKFELQEYRKSKADVLSGGYKQRFLIARALMNHPKLVILDEPTVGLDPKVRRKLWDHISALREENVTVILTTHYLDEAEILSDRVCVIDEGVVKVIDTPENLKNKWKQKNLEDVFIHLTEVEEKEESNE